MPITLTILSFKCIGLFIAVGLGGGPKLSCFKVWESFSGVVDGNNVK